jgi:iron complex outermembrane recepter protein
VNNQQSKRPISVRTTGRAAPAAKMPSPGMRGPLAASISLILASTSAVYAQQSPGQPAGPPAGKLDTLEEVTVTAQRRVQSVQDIPYNISVVSGDELTRTGTTGLNDLARIVPGLIYVDAGPAARGNTNDLTLRGLRTDGPGGAGNNGTDVPAQTVNSVSTYFGETPVFFPIAMHDIERVEVLRGPQGTLYGSGAQAGTIRFIPRRPTFDAFSGEVSASGGFTSHADGKANGSVDAVLNIPLSANLALRVLAGDEKLAGFINQVALWQRQSGDFLAPATLSVPGDPANSGPVLQPVKKGTNSSDQSYARAALRWEPADAWDLQLDYLHQHTQVDDVQTSNPTYPGGNEVLATGQDPLSPNSHFIVPAGGAYDATNAALQPYHDTFDLVSLVASVDVGLSTFTSATSYYHDDSYAATEIIGNFVIPGGTNFLTFPYYSNYPRALGLETTPVSENSFTQEVRLVSNKSSAVDYVVGAFYRNQRVSSDTRQYLPGITAYRNLVGNPQPYQGLPDLEFNYDRQTRFVDEAVFGEVTFHPTAAWQVTGGARLFRQTFENTTLQQIPLCGAGCSADGVDPTGLSVATIQTKVNNHVFKLNTAYDLTAHTKIYATYSEGFRRGGANSLPQTGAYASLPEYQTFQPDLAKNYELGVKGTAFEQTVRYTADVFLIDLSNFQFAFSTLSGIPATFNGSKAQSKGVELEIQARPTGRLNVTLGYTYTDAVVKESKQFYDLGFCGDPVCLLTSLTAGAQLPGVPKNTLTAAMDYLLPISGAGSHEWSLNFHADGSYRDASTSVIDPTSRSYWVIPSSTIVNASISLAAGSSWTYDLFVNNVTDEVGYSGGRGTAQDPTTFQPLPNLTATRVVTRPRTIGVRLRYKF